MFKDKSLYKQGENRKQGVLFPPSIDEYVSDESVARAIDVYVESLNLVSLGFKDTRKSFKKDGNRAYHPKVLLKIYIYGYINGIKSSRKLQRECKRNVELIFLTEGLQPSYHTISNFRSNNPNALKNVFKEFTLLCKNLDLLETSMFALDGAFLKANASKNTLLTQKSLQKELNQIDKNIEEYLKELQTNDEENSHDDESQNFPKSIEKLKQKRDTLRKNLKLLKDKNLTQLNKTDSDAKLMIKPSHNLMAYNSQITVDTNFKFIVATDVINKGSDSTSLYHMAKSTKETLDKTSLVLLADKGYYASTQIKQCVDENISAYVPVPQRTSSQKAKGFFTKEEFIYSNSKDCYICPNNKQLTKEKTIRIHRGRVEHVYSTKTTTCKQCALRDNCIPNKAKYKRLFIYEHEYIIKQHKAKMQTKGAKELMIKRASSVEHLFGTIKRTLGWDHYTVRGLEKVKGENALIMFTYNFKRLLNLIGIPLFKKAILALKTKDKNKIQQIKEEIWRYILTFMQFNTETNLNLRLNLCLVKK